MEGDQGVFAPQTDKAGPVFPLLYDLEDLPFEWTPSGQAHPRFPLPFRRIVCALLSLALTDAGAVPRHANCGVCRLPFEILYRIVSALRVRTDFARYESPDFVAGLDADILRLSSLHSWYKYLSISGTDFFFVPLVGEEPRHNDVRHDDRVHWHLLRTHAVLQFNEWPIIAHFSVRLNCFFGHVCLCDGEWVVDGERIAALGAGFDAWARKNYPCLERGNEGLRKIMLAEFGRQAGLLRENAAQLWAALGRRVCTRRVRAF